MNSEIAQASIKVVADIGGAKASLNEINRTINNLVPGTKVATNVVNRLAGGFYQLVQGISANTFSIIAGSMRKFAQAGIDTAKALDQANVGLQTVLESGEDINALLRDIQKNAVTTPFDIEGLAKGTQQLAMVTKNGTEAERTILNLGKAVAAGGGDTEQLNRLSAALQKVGLNSTITQREIRQFGTASVPIIEMVADTVGIATDEVSDYLKNVSNPYDVLVEAINRAGEEGGRFANQYTASAMTMGQVTENLNDSFGIFARSVGEASGVFTKLKEGMMAVAEKLIDPQVIGTLAESFRKLTENINLADIATRAIDKLVQILSAFNAGQFDNFFVFFRELFATLRQSGVIGIFTRAFQVLIDLFSDNHTADEVKRVAQELGRLISTIVEFKVILTIAGYISRIGTAAGNAINMIMQLVNSVKMLPQVLSGLGGGFKSLFSIIAKHPFITLAAGITAVVYAIAKLNPEGFKKFVDTIKNGAKQAIQFLASLPQALITLGSNIITGLWNGMVSAANSVVQWVANLGRTIVTTLKNALGIHSPSTVMRDEVGRPVDQGIAEGIRRNYGTVINALDEVMEKLAQKQADWVKEISSFGALDLVQQINTYRNFAALYQEGSKARLEMDEKVHDAEVSILKEIIDLTDDFNTQFLKSAKNAKEFYNLFEYTQGVITRTTASVIEGLNRQNNNMLQYLRNLQKINSMGFDSDFLQTVMDQGMDAAGEVAGLAEATEDQINEINELWKTRGQIATDIAVQNTKQLRTETLEQIDYLQSGLDKKIVNVSDSGTLLIKSFTVGIYDGMPTLEDALAEIEKSASSAGKSASGSLGGVADSFDDITAAVGGALAPIDDFNDAWEKLSLETFDLNGLFGTFKNLLSGIPWYYWAGAIALLGSNILTKVVPSVKNVLDMGKPLTTLTKKVLADGTETVETITKTVKNGVTTTIKSVDGVQKSVSQTGRGIEKISTDTSNNVAKTAETASNRATESVKKSGDLSYRNTLSSTSKIGKAIKKPFQILNTLLDSLTSVLENALTSVGRVIQKGIKVIINILNEALSGIMKLINTVFKGIGKALKSLLKELSDPKLLIGVGVLAALAATLAILGGALLIFNNVQWESLAKGAVALAGLAVIAAAMGAGAGYIIAGAAAIGALGIAIGLFATLLGAGLWALTAGLKAAADNLAAVGDVVQNINKGALADLLSIIGEVSIILTALIGFEVFGAVGAICAAVIGQGLLLAAQGLAEVQVWVDLISLDAIRQFAQLLVEVTNILNEINAWDAFKATIVVIIEDVISGGLWLAATLLKQTCDVAAEIESTDGITKITDMMKKATNALNEINAWDAFKGMLKGIVEDVISLALLVAAKSLKEAAEIGGQISETGLDKLGQMCGKAVDAMKNISAADAVKGAIKSVVTDVISVALVGAAKWLKEASEYGDGISRDGMVKLNNAIVDLHDYIIPNLNSLSLWDTSTAKVKLDDAKGLIEKLVAISFAMKDIQDIGNAKDNVHKIVEAMTEELTQLPSKLASYDSTFQMQGQTWAWNLIQGWESQMGNFEVAGNRAQNAIWSAIESKMSDEYQQGSWLAYQILNGFYSRIPEFGPLGAQAQGQLWQGIQAKFPDEYQQGRALAEQVYNGIVRFFQEGHYSQAGAWVVAGFADGMNATIWRVNAAVGNLSSAAVNKLRELLGIASPSKVFAELGEYVTIGFAEGMENNIDDVESVGEKLAEAVMRGYNNTMVPLSASAELAGTLSGANETSPAPIAGVGRNVIINQTNNVYDEMDETKLLSDLAWAVSRS